MTKASRRSRVKEALTEFNDREWQVASALNLLDMEKLVSELKLNLATVSALDLLRAGKISLRHDIQQEINFYGQRGVKPDRKRVRELITAIENLNQSIHEVELLVNTRARN